MHIETFTCVSCGTAATCNQRARARQLCTVDRSSRPAFQNVPVAPRASVVCKLRPERQRAGHCRCHRSRKWRDDDDPVTTCHVSHTECMISFRRPRSLHRLHCCANAFLVVTSVYRSFEGHLQRSVFAPRFRDHHQMPFKNPLRRWRRIELPPVDAPLLPGESRMIRCIVCHILLIKPAAAMPVESWSSLPIMPVTGA